MDLLAQMLRILIRWVPDRTFVCCADGNYAAHELAELAAAHPQRLTLVSKFYAEANLFEPPPPYAGAGRPRVKGPALPKPRQAAAAARRRRATVGWYGGGTRRVGLVTGTGRWYKSGRGLVPLRWVFVRDQSGTHRDEYLYSTDPALLPEAVVGYYTARWNIETTFAEMRSCLGLESTRGWCARTVLRAAPCLFGLYSAVAVVYRALPESERSATVTWPGKSGVTFSDALAAVRRWLWSE